MLGIYRTILAFFVVYQHVVQEPRIGRFAVFGFFILSGYLMTTIMQDRYGYTNAGRKSLAINRFLRIYPAYWFVCVVTLALCLLQPET